MVTVLWRDNNGECLWFFANEAHWSRDGSLLIADVEGHDNPIMVPIQNFVEMYTHSH